jgi:hypothetical protein
MTWGKHKTQGKGKPNVNRNQKNPERKKIKPRWTRHQLEVGDKKESRNYWLSCIWIRHKIRAISIFVIVFHLDFNLISIQPT